MPPTAAVIGLLAAVVQPIVGRAIGSSAWSGCFCGDRAGTWPVGITLAIWYSAIAVVLGAVLARVIARRMTRSVPEYLKAILPAAVGVVFALPVIAALAGTAKVPEVMWPGLNIALSVPIGALLGIGVSYAALRYRIVALGIWAHIGWVWFLAFASVVLSWEDEVRQSVPLGAAHIGGPPSEAPPIEQTVYDIAVAMVNLFAALGPAVIAGLIAWWALRERRPLAEMAAAALAGPVIVFASYLLRPDALSADNLSSFGLAVRTLLLAGAAVGGVLLMQTVWRPNEPDAVAAETSPLVKVELAEKPEEKP